MSQEFETALTHKWIELEKVGNYGEIISEAASYLVKFSASNSPENALSCLEMIEMAAAKIGVVRTSENSFSLVNKSEHCSFCGKSRRDVRLGAGPKVFICEECVSLFANEFFGGKLP
jgi:ClpX C4-type zinc finger